MSGPFNAMRLRRVESRTAAGGTPFVSLRMVSLSGWRSHWTGAHAAAKTFCTAAAISGPMPSPAIKVTVCIMVRLLPRIYHGHVCREVDSVAGGERQPMCQRRGREEAVE